MEKKIKTWEVKRYIIEYYEGEGITREEALINVAEKGDPFKMILIKETAKCVKEKF